MKNLKRWFEERYLDGDKMEDGHSMLSSQECFEAIKDALAEKEKEIVEIVEKYKSLARYGNNDELNNSYEMAFEEIINLIKNNEQRN